MDSLQQWQQLQPLWLWAPQWRRPRVPRAPVTAARAQPLLFRGVPVRQRIPLAIARAWWVLVSGCLS